MKKNAENINCLDKAKTGKDNELTSLSVDATTSTLRQKAPENSFTLFMDPDKLCST